MSFFSEIVNSLPFLYQIITIFSKFVHNSFLPNASLWYFISVICRRSLYHPQILQKTNHTLLPCRSCHPYPFLLLLLLPLDCDRYFHQILIRSAGMYSVRNHTYIPSMKSKFLHFPLLLTFLHHFHSDISIILCSSHIIWMLSRVALWSSLSHHTLQPEIHRQN